MRKQYGEEEYHRLKKIINYIDQKFSNTVFGDAAAGVKYLYNKNEKILTVEMIVSYLASILITGWLILTIENLNGHGYIISLRNIIGIWVRSGIVISLAVFFFVQMAIFRCIRLFRIKYYKDEEGNYNVSTEGTYGTSRKMTEEDMKEAFILEPIDSIKTIIFGKNPYNLKQMVGQRGADFRKVNRNVLMVSGPSSGKSATFVINALFQIMRKGESAIVSDPKSELFKICAELAKTLGYEVRILNLNPMFLANSDPCNYFMYVGGDVDKAQVVANAIIANTTGGEAMFDFWNEGALNLLQALILRINVGNDFLPEEKNLPFLFQYVIQNTLEDLEADFEGLSQDHPAYAPFMIFKDGDDKPKKQVLQGLRIKLKLFNSKKLRKILSETRGGIDILNPGRKKCMYFVGSNDQDSSMASMVSLFYTLLYQELVRYADSRSDQKLPVTVHMVLDEYANMGSIPDFEKKLSTVRSRNIVTYIILQDINQLKLKHPHDAWRTVVNDCDYYMLLKTNDTETSSWFEELSGKTTSSVQNIKYDKSKLDILGIHVQESITEGQGERSVYIADEIRKLQNDEVMIYVTQRNIAKLKTLFWKEHPFGKYLEKHPEMYIAPVQHYPLWRLIEDGIVSEDFDYDNGPTYTLELPPDEKIEIDKNYDADKILKLKKEMPKIGKISNLKEKTQNTIKQSVKEKKNELTEKIDDKKSVLNNRLKKILPTAEAQTEEEEEVIPKRITVPLKQTEDTKENTVEQKAAPVKAEKKPNNQSPKKERVKKAPPPPKAETFFADTDMNEEFEKVVKEMKQQQNKPSEESDKKPAQSQAVEQEKEPPKKTESKPPALDDFFEADSFFDDNAINMDDFLKS